MSKSCFVRTSVNGVKSIFLRRRSPRLIRTAGIDSAIAKSWVDEGFGKLGIPAEYGGTPCDHVTMAIAIEELCHIGGNIPMAPNLLIMFDVCEFGTEEPDQVRGRLLL